MTKFEDENFDMMDETNKVGREGIARPQKNYRFVNRRISYKGKGLKNTFLGIFWFNMTFYCPQLQKSR